MTIKWPGAILLLVLGCGSLVCGLLVPAHLRAVDSGLVQRAGWDGPALLDRGRALVDERRLGSALLIAQAARQGIISGWDRLGETITNLARQFPSLVMWGDGDGAKEIFTNAPAKSEPVIVFLVRRADRGTALAHLEQSPVAAVRELLLCRELKNTALLPPSASAAGQAFDTALAEVGLLLEGGKLTSALSNSIAALAVGANRGRGSETLEQALLDFTSLGGQFNWDQLTAFVAEIPDTRTLGQLTAEAQGAGGKLPVLFAAVQLTGRPANVADYLAKFPQTGLADLTASLDAGAGGLNRLMQSGRRLYHEPGARLVANCRPLRKISAPATALAFQKPRLAMAAKWFAYLLGGFLCATAVRVAQPAVSPLEQPLRVRGLHLFRESLFALGFLLVVLLLSEPFLVQENQQGIFLLRPRLPMAGGAAPAGIAGLAFQIMNPIILITLLLFFVLQALLYLACILKLAEIRRQAVPPRMKLKLLENEDHLFDAGLYLGFVGTVVSLIVASLGLVKFSLMAAYSSTSFGIIFVSIFKIFHLRPARRKLLLEADAAEAYAAATSARIAEPEVVPS